jgi:hypothetical protein
LNYCLRAGRLARWSFALTNHTGWWTRATDLSLRLHKWNGLKVAWTPKTWSQVPSLGGPGSFTNAPMLSRIHPVSQQHSSPCLDFKNQSSSISESWTCTRSQRYQSQSFCSNIVEVRTKVQMICELTPGLHKQTALDNQTFRAWHLSKPDL